VKSSLFRCLCGCLVCACAIASCTKKGDESKTAQQSGDIQSEQQAPAESAAVESAPRIEPSLPQELLSAIISEGRSGVVLFDSVPVCQTPDQDDGPFTALCNTGDIVMATNASSGNLPDGTVGLKYLVRIGTGDVQGWVDASTVKLFDGTGDFDYDYFVGTYIDLEQKDTYDTLQYLSTGFYQRLMKNPKLSKMSQRLALIHGGRPAVILNDNIVAARHVNGDTTLNSGEKVIALSQPPQNGSYSAVLEDGSVGQIAAADLFIFNNIEAWEAYINNDSLSQPAEVQGEPAENGAILYSEPFLKRASDNNHAYFSYTFQHKLKLLSGTSDNETTAE
jgi:hypothetical protein